MSVMYSPKDVQKLLKINSNTLRKYANHLEEHGYPIHRNTRGHRSFFEKDVNTLRQLIEFSKQEGMTWEQSVEAVMACVSEEIKSDTSSGPIQITNDRDVEQDFHHNELLENLVEGEMIELSEVNESNNAAGTIKITNDRDIQQDRNHQELLERIEHLEQINMDLIKLLKEKAVREASLEEKLNHIVKFVDRSEQLVAERYKLMEEETRMQIAAAQQKKWWQWWK
ncbi:MerR family transcriptional regulator [Neobacillus niacini]|uniref:MerR family transcriptional regulator n=1 Tax=Neobacillus niacini TaxID=86668 RepID=UPI0028623D67|nr:MerR family transcriptional regulator [Neobacillus niacini]MDR6999600.1 DNA-binding transcriptional MerR regulator [Neobacillus niacini]